MKYLTQSSNRKEQSRMMESRVQGNREEKWSCCLMGQVMGIEFQFCKMKRCKDMFHNNVIRNPMVVQRLGVHAFLSGAWVWFSTRKLSFKLHSTAKTMTTTTKQHCDSVCVCVCVCVLVTQSCTTLCVLMDCSPPGSFVHGVLQARILEWVAISFSKKADESM